MFERPLHFFVEVVLFIRFREIILLPNRKKQYLFKKNKMTKYLFLLFPLMVFSQKEVDLPTTGSLKDPSGKTKNLVVLDERSNPNLGTIQYKNQTLQFVTKEVSLKQFFEDWFKKNNKNPKGDQNIVLLIEDIEFLNEVEDDKNFLKADVRASTFVEKDGQYYFIRRINTTVTPGELPNSPLGISVAVPLEFASLMRASYLMSPSVKPITATQLKDYAAILSADLPVFQGNTLKDGVYKDYSSFFSQQPEVGYHLVRNNNNNVTKASNGQENIAGHKIYAYVENGVAYKNTAGGFMEMKKDTGGFYVISNRGTLAPVQMDSTYGMFGLVGAGIGAIATNAKNKKLQQAEKYNIYIDPLSGGYIYKK